MTKQTFLDIGPSQIRPVGKMATIFQKWPPTISISNLSQPVIVLEL